MNNVIIPQTGKKEEYYFKFFPQTVSEVKVIGQQLDFVLWQGSQWSVTDYGFECRDGNYAVEAKRMYSCAYPRNENKKITKQCVFIHWFEHLSRKCWIEDINDLDHALQAFLLLFDENGRRTDIKVPLIMNEAEAIEYATNCANYAYENAYKRAIKGLVNDA